MTTVAIMGCSGMLGRMTLEIFAEDAGFDVVAVVRKKLRSAAFVMEQYPTVEFREMDAASEDRRSLVEAVRGTEWVINAIGVIKPYIHEDNAAETERAIRVNSLFPYLLGEAAGEVEGRVIQIATDCVFAGDR